MSANTPTATPGAGDRPGGPPPLGLRAAFRAPAERFEAAAAQAMALIDEAEAVVAEPPRWRLGRTPLWTARLSLGMQALVRQLVLLLTFGLVRLDSPRPGTDPGIWTLRQQILLARLPALRREIAAIHRRHQPVDQRPLADELRQYGRLRAALWWSPRAMRLRLQILWLQVQVAAVWLWVNRETIFFTLAIVAIFVGLVVLIQLLQDQQSAILDFVDSVRPTMPRSFFPDEEPFMPGGDGGP